VLRQFLCWQNFNLAASLRRHLLTILRRALTKLGRSTHCFAATQSKRVHANSRANNNNNNAVILGACFCKKLERFPTLAARLGQTKRERHLTVETSSQGMSEIAFCCASNWNLMKPHRKKWCCGQAMNIIYFADSRQFRALNIICLSAENYARPPLSY
jgi:hypothetical protein